MISLLLCINIISHSLAHNILNLSSNISIYILNHTRIIHRQSKVSQYEKKISWVKRNKTLWNYYTKHKQKSAKCKSPGPEFHCNANPINSVLWDYLFVPSKIRIIFFSLCVLKCILSPYLFWTGYCSITVVFPSSKFVNHLTKTNTIGVYFINSFVMKKNPVTFLDAFQSLYDRNFFLRQCYSQGSLKGSPRPLNISYFCFSINLNKTINSEYRIITKKIPIFPAKKKTILHSDTKMRNCIILQWN